MDGAELWNDLELVKANGYLGAVGLLAYLGAIDWSAKPGDVVVQSRTKQVCPRCRAFDVWAAQWCPDLEKRAGVVAELICKEL